MKPSFAFYVDIDNTIAAPRWYDEDLQTCKQHYVDAGLVTVQEAAAIEYHQRLFLLPHVLITHLPLPGSVETLQRLAQTDHCVTYLTVRNSIQPEQCRQVHEQTRAWLEQEGFPNPRQVQFFWDFPEKLIATLEAPTPRILFIDDRPRHLLEGYRRLVERDPEGAAQVRKRVILVAFGNQALDGFPQRPFAPRVVPLAEWAHFGKLLSQLEGECLIE
ncbi:MAG TPA: hypothetical protein VFV38_20810 [Ktedonobacteraceae bacterium]|nr:hypothetical protein [Ktedonobacteraceae bacterium]